MASGVGAFVSVNDQHVRLDDMAKEIQDTITYTRSYADTFMGTLTTSINNLNNIVSTYTPSIDDIDTSAAGIDGPSFPNRPTFLPLELDDDWPDSNITDPTFLSYGAFNFDFVVPPAPTELDENFTWTEDNYSSALWLTLYSTVHNAILNADYGLPTDVHGALVAKEQETRRINQDREFQVGLNAIGEMGWNLPAGHNTSFLDSFQEKVLKGDQDALNNITIKDFDITNENRKFFVTAASDVSKAEQDLFNRAEDRSLDAAKAAKEYLARFKSENVKVYLAKIDAESKRLDGLKTKIEAIATRNESEVTIYEKRADVLTAKVRAISEKNKGIVDTRKGEIDVYATEVSAVSAEYSALIEEAKINQNSVKLEIDKLLGLEQLKLKAYSDKAALATSIGQGIANIGSQGVASALGAIHTSLSNSYSGTETRREGWDFNAAIRESHDYTEK